MVISHIRRKKNYKNDIQAENYWFYNNYNRDEWEEIKIEEEKINNFIFIIYYNFKSNTTNNNTWYKTIIVVV